MTKKVLNLLTALVMAISLVSVLPAVTASAETYSGKCGENVNWSLDTNTGILTISGTGDMDDFDDYYVYSYWYNYHKYITKVEIQSGVTSIGDYAFDDCNYLTRVTIPDSIINIGNNAFDYCNSLTSVTIPNGVKSIGDNAFTNCGGLTSVTISNSVTSIGYDAFYACDILLEIIVDSSNKYYLSQDGVLFNFDKTELIKYPSGKTQTDYIIPDSVIRIEDSAFWNCGNLTSVTIGNSVANIGVNAFQYCYNLTSIITPDSVTSVGDGAFSDCKSLISVKIGNSVTSIGVYAFIRCDSLLEINVDSSNEYYSSQDGVLFNYEQTELIQYPRGKIQTIYTIPNSVINIGNYAFHSCNSLTNVTIGNNVRDIGNCAFMYCDSITNITIPNSVTSIGYDAFCCDSLISVTIPERVILIGECAFGYDFDFFAGFYKLSNFKIYCYAGTAGEQYAIENDFEYELLLDSDVKPPKQPPTQNHSNSPSQNSNNNSNNTNKPNQTVSPVNKAKTPSTTKVTVPKPAKVKSVKLTAKKKKLNVSWKKVSGATGYEVMYATNNKFTKNKKSVTVKKNSVTLKNLKPKKKYFVKVRAYKKENGSTYYGKWSKVVKKKTK